MFPVFDLNSQVVAFGARVFKEKDKKEIAKYINTPETPAYHKSEMLFGLNFAKGDIKKKGFAIITEGELDVISPFQRGVKNVVAIKGSALTDAHVRLLGRFTKKLTLALDSDFAGNTAAKRGIEIAQNSGLKINVARLKGFKDPDEMAVKNIDSFSKSIEDATPVYDFIIDSAIERHNSETVEGKVDISKEVIPFLSKINDEIMKAYYVELLAKKLKVPYESVYTEVEKSKISALSKKEGIIKERPIPKRREVVEENLLALVILNDIEKSDKYKKYFKSPFNKKIIGELLPFKKEKDFNVKKFLGSLPAELKDRFRDIYMTFSIDYEDVPVEKQLKEIDYLKKTLQIIDLSDSHKELIAKIKGYEKDKNKEEVQILQKKLNDLVKVKMKLTAELE